MSRMSELYTALILNGVNPNTTDEEHLNTIYELYKYFHNIDYAVEAFKEGYTAEQLKKKGNYPPYWVYLIWVKK